MIIFHNISRMLPQLDKSPQTKKLNKKEAWYRISNIEWRMGINLYNNGERVIRVAVELPIPLPNECYIKLELNEDEDPTNDMLGKVRLELERLLNFNWVGFDFYIKNFDVAYYIPGDCHPPNVSNHKPVEIIFDDSDFYKKLNENYNYFINALGCITKEEYIKEIPECVFRGNSETNSYNGVIAEKFKMCDIDEWLF